jgi:hypothetical protein
MPTLPHWFWLIAGLTGVGAFIDFLLGRAGQIYVKSVLETWWIRISDVQIHNFGKEEASCAVDIMDRLFGDKFFSSRRAKSVILALTSVIVLSYVLTILNGNQLGAANNYLIAYIFSYGLIGCIVKLITPFIGISASISLTRVISSQIEKRCGISAVANLAVFSLVLIFNYCLIGLWIKITRITSLTMIFFVTSPTNCLHQLLVKGSLESCLSWEDLIQLIRWRISDIIEMFDIHALLPKIILEHLSIQLQGFRANVIELTNIIAA